MQREKLRLRELKLSKGTLLMAGLEFKAQAPLMTPQAVRAEST